MENEKKKKSTRLTGFLTGFVILFAGITIGLFMSQSSLIGDIKVPFTDSKTISEVLNKDPSYKLEGSLYPVSNNTINFNLFWQVWDEIEKQFVDKNIDEKLLFEGAIKGMVAALGDPATSFYTAEETAEYDKLSAGEFEGIGAELGYKQAQIVVVTPLKGSPAEKAGLMAGDAIMKVNGESTEGMEITEAVMKIRGEAGTTVTLTIMNGGAEEKDIVITRGSIYIPSIEYEELADGVINIQINRFTDDTYANFVANWDKVVGEVRAKNPSKLIIDLRSNPGGFLDAAPYIANDFLPKNTLILKTESRDKIEKEFRTTKEGAFLKIPVVILVNEGTASASEIFAGAMKQAGRAKVIGEKTTGKGTSQVILNDNSWGGATLHLTIQKWLLPDGSWLNPENPIVPDIEVELTREDFKEGKDPQIDKALEVLRGL